LRNRVLSEIYGDITASASKGEYHEKTYKTTSDSFTQYAAGIGIDLQLCGILDPVLFWCARGEAGAYQYCGIICPVPSGREGGIRHIHHAYLPDSFFILKPV